MKRLVRPDRLRRRLRTWSPKHVVNVTGVREMAVGTVARRRTEHALKGAPRK